MASTVLGSLLVQLGMDSAQFERSAQRAESAVSRMSKNIGAQSRDVIAAANRMGMSVTAFASQVQSLQARVNPGAQALANYRREMDLLRNALRIGAISQDQFRQSVQTAVTNYRNASGNVQAANGRTQAGMQQLSFQLNDVATQWASGTKPMQIFAQQAGQIVQSIQLMSNSASRFGAFMAGPWGMALTAGVVVVSALIPKLLETESAMKDVEMASSGLSDAQSVLGDMFDLTTGKLKNQNEMLRLNAQLMAINLRAQASAQRTNAQSTFGKFGQGSIGLSAGQLVLSSLGVPTGKALGREDKVRQLAQDVLGGKYKNNMQGAAKAAEGLDFSGLAITKQEFLTAISDAVSAPLKDKTAAAIEKSLADGSLDPSLMREGRAKKKRGGKSAADIAAEQAAAISRLNIEELQAKMDLAKDTQDRADIASQILDAERKQRIAEVQNNKDFSDEQKKAQIAYIERLYGNGSTVGPDGTITVGKPGLLRQKQLNDVRDEELRIANDALDMQADTLRSLAEIEPNARKRAALEAEALKIQQQIEKNLLEQDIANGKIADAAQARALLAQRQQVAQTALERRNMSPGQRYMADLQDAAQNASDAIEGVAVNALESLNDQLADAIVNFKSLGDVAANVFKQILADLLRIQLRKSIIEPLAKLLNLGGAVSGGGTSAFANVNLSTSDFSSWASATIAGARASGGPVHIGQSYLVGERGPEIFTPKMTGRIIANDDIQGGGARVQVIPSPYFDVVVNGHIQRAAPSIAGLGAAEAATRANRSSSRRIG